MSGDPPRAPLTWGEAAAGLRLGIGARHGLLRLVLENVGSGPLQVLSHVRAGGETHFDWITLSLDGPSGGRTLALMDERNRSAAVTVTLEAGEAVQHEIDVPAWARREANGAQALAPGRYVARAVYEVPASAQAWSGRLEAGPAELDVGS
jgi:hypothetical protein